MQPPKLKGNDGASARRSDPSVREVLERTRRLSDDLDTLAGALGDVARGWQALLRARMEREPYATLAVATGVGYVLGGGVPTAVGRALIGIGGRLAVEQLLARFAAGHSQ